MSRSSPMFPFHFQSPVRYGAQPEEAEGDMASGAFFSSLGVNLPLGHASQRRRNPPLFIAVISYNYWTRFARNPASLNTLFVNAVP